MAKAPLFTLDPKPTFKLPIEIPRPGESEPGKMTFTVRHRPIDEFSQTMQDTERKLSEYDDNDPDGFNVMVEAIMHVAEGWNLPDEFNAENVRRLVVNYPRAFGVFHTSYYLELMGLREKN
ncbi:hypothetical protein jat_50 [Escherichia phage jat]|uniref:Tape measure chaperone n=1 Tax=Escherichia phage jat TaxID=2696411 RepID=A0A6B9XI72_9CAUD|nr:hypothetical protein P9623_gp50 [Escherichia phage jat]QHR76430.1 hypothetical protein jat_50 [Escherichia phage jat]